MSQRRSSLRVLAQAKEREKKYDWLQAVESYNEAQTSVLKQKNFQKAGEIQERIGFCFQNAAMQAESREEFREKMQYSIEAYSSHYSSYLLLSLNDVSIRIARVVRTALRVRGCYCMEDIKKNTSVLLFLNI